MLPIVRSLRSTGLVSLSVRRAMSTNTSNSENNNASRRLDFATLDVLTESIKRDRARPVSEAAQRFQKIHRVGDVYHPDDLNDARYQEQLKQRRGRQLAKPEDPFKKLDLSPLHEYKNFKLLSEFVSDMGRILPREQTGLSAKNQRKLARAIKRARAMGLMSYTNKNVIESPQVL